MMPRLKKCASFHLILALIFVAFFSCTPKTPEYLSIENFRVDAFGLKKSVVSADLKYYNPNNFGLQLRKAEADFYINGTKTGRSVLDTLINIPKKDSFFLPVKMTVDMKDVFPNALDLLLTREVLLKIEGKAYLRKEGINFSVPLRYEGIQKIN